MSPSSDANTTPKITAQVVAKVAHLARLDLTEAELALMTTQLTGMLDHFGVIDKLDLSAVAPMAQPFPIKNVYREDVVVPGLDRQEVLDNAPAPQDGRFRVPPSNGSES